jgi:hypothetical protein
MAPAARRPSSSILLLYLSRKIRGVGYIRRSIPGDAGSAKTSASARIDHGAGANAEQES